MSEVVEKALLEPFLPVKKGSTSTSTQSDLKKEVVVRDVKMSNLTGMRFNGGEYEIVASTDMLIPQEKIAVVETSKEKVTV